MAMSIGLLIGIVLVVIMVLFLAGMKPAGPAPEAARLEDIPPDVVRFLRANRDNKIACIKKLREAMPMGLAAAKQTVEAWLAANPAGPNGSSGPIIERRK